MPNNLFSEDAKAQLKALKKQLETKKSDNAIEKPEQSVQLPSEKKIDKQVKAHLKKITGQQTDNTQTRIDTDALADELLFKQAMSGVVPLADKNTVTPSELSQKNRHSKRQDANTLTKRASAQGSENASGSSDIAISDMQAMLNPVSANAYLMYKDPTLQHRIFSQLKEGKLRWFDAVDIHGSTIEEAREAVLKIITMTQNNGHNVLKIVHGKGSSSNSPESKQAVLKTCVNGWLRQHPDVLAFCSATPKDGGTGAVVVLIKRQETTKQSH